jgi:ribosome modulation factor
MEQTPYDEGYESHSAGLFSYECPFEDGSQEARAWLDGWWDAEAGWAKEDR